MTFKFDWRLHGAPGLTELMLWITTLFDVTVSIIFAAATSRNSNNNSSRGFKFFSRARPRAPRGRLFTERAPRFVAALRYDSEMFAMGAPRDARWLVRRAKCACRRERASTGRVQSSQVQEDINVWSGAVGKCVSGITPREDANKNIIEYVRLAVAAVTCLGALKGSSEIEPSTETQTSQTRSQPKNSLS